MPKKVIGTDVYIEVKCGSDSIIYSGPASEFGNAINAIAADLSRRDVYSIHDDPDSNLMAFHKERWGERYSECYLRFRVLRVHKVETAEIE